MRSQDRIPLKTIALIRTWILPRVVASAHQEDASDAVFSWLGVVALVLDELERDIKIGEHGACVLLDGLKLNEEITVPRSELANLAQILVGMLETFEEEGGRVSIDMAFHLVAARECADRLKRLMFAEDEQAVH